MHLRSLRFSKVYVSQNYTEDATDSNNPNVNPSSPDANWENYQLRINPTDNWMVSNSPLSHLLLAPTLMHKCKVGAVVSERWHMNTGRQRKLSDSPDMRSRHPTYRVTTVSARQICRYSTIEMWEATVCPLRQPDKARFVALESLKTSPSSLWLWLWEVNIWTHWDWAARRHKLWPGQSGNPPLCCIHNNVPTFVNLTLS